MQDEIVFKPKFTIPPAAKKNVSGADRTGLVTWRNMFNGFVVCAVHYTADPAKRSHEWYKKAIENLREDQVQREMEIDFESRAGQKAFWFLRQHENKYRIPDIPLNEVPKHWRIIAGLDYGSREPTAIIIFGIDEYRRFYALQEFYKPSHHKEIARFLKGEHEDYPHPLWNRIEKVIADPSLFRADQEDQLKEELGSRADLIRREGVWNIYRGTNDRLAGLERVRQMFNFFPEQKELKPYVFFCQRCEKTWWELTNLIYDEIPPHLLVEKNQREDVKQKNDHLYDALRYSLMSVESPSDQPVIDVSDTGTLEGIEKQLTRQHNELENDFY